MKQKSILFLSAALIAFGMLAFTAAITTHKVDTKNSNLHWTGYKVTGKHEGNVNIKSGELKFNGSKLVGGSFVIDMTSISSTDLSGESADKLVGHLKSDDFFGTAKHPTASFKITSAVHQGKDLYKITGDLTIKKITKKARFNATVKDEGGIKSAESTIKIDRSDFNIKYGSGSFFDDLGDKTIYDDFDLHVKLVTHK